MRRYLVQFWQSLSVDWQVLSEKQLPAEELNGLLKQASLPSTNFYSLLVLATAIATLGLLANNAATIIGAMIVAPLMNPIVTLAYATITVEWRLLVRATLTLVTGMISVLAIAFFATNLVGTRVVGFQILARIEPNLLDLGVAFASGAAAGLAYSRRSVSNALPGVAIAVALVPPLCVTGIGLALREDIAIDIGFYFGRDYQPLNMASGAFLLFLTNLAGIIFCAGLVFLIQGYGSCKKAAAGLSLTLVILGLLSLPLQFQLQKFLLRNKVLQSLDKFTHIHIEEKEWLARTDAIDMYVDNQEQEIYVQLRVLAPIGEFSKQDVALVREFLSKELDKPVKLEVNLFPFQIL